MLRFLAVFHFWNATRAAYEGDMVAAHAYIRRAINRGREHYISPHVLQFSVLVAEQKEAEAMLKLRQIDRMLDAAPRMTDATKNYIRYYMKNQISEGSFEHASDVVARYPRDLGIENVSRSILQHFPFRPPSPAMLRALGLSDHRP